MKIVIFCYEFPPIGGGAGRALLHLASSWVSLGHETLVVTSCYSNLPLEESVRGIRVKRLSVGRKSQNRGRVWEMLKFMFLSFLKSGAIYREEGPDITVAFMTIPCGLAPFWIKLRYKVPYAVELRGGDVPGFNPEILKFYHFCMAPLIRLIWKNAKVVIANGRGLAELAGTIGTRKGDIRVIPNGVDSMFYGPREVPVPHQGMTMLFVGRLVDAQKNISTLIRALGFNEDSRLVLVGAGPDRSKLEELARSLGVAERMQFTGWLSDMELVSAYQNADVYTSASLWEGMPNTVLEAMACGLPVILSDMPSHRELAVHGENGYFFKPTDAEELGCRIKDLKANETLRHSMGGRNRRNMVESYDWRKLAERHLEVF